MKKILFPCDTNNFPSGAFQFIESLHQTEEFLTGVFVHSENYDVLVPTNYIFQPDALVAYSEADVKAVQESINMTKNETFGFLSKNFCFLLYSLHFHL